MAKDTQKPPRKDSDQEIERKHIDPRAHRRLLRFINAAEKPEDLMVAPHDRKFVDEEEAHTDHIEHHQEEEQLLDREQAKQILEARDQTSPLRGFARLTDLFDIDVRFADLLDRFLSKFGPAKYGRWDLLYPLNPGGSPFAIEHAALLRTYKVVFIADSTDTAL